MKDTNSLSHTSYRCKYHIVIVPKYRRMIIYNRLRRDIIQILTLLINRKPSVKLIDIWSTCKLEIQIWESTFLGERIFCRYRRKEWESYKGIYTKSIAGR